MSFASVLRASQVVVLAWHRWWAVTGLGARGLVYHAWLGTVLANAVIADDESVLAPELLRWQPESDEDE
jgi:hypothetical protein